MLAGRGFAFAGSRVGVTSDDAALLDWLEEFLSPALDAIPPEDADVGVAIRRDPERHAAIASARPAGALPTVPCFARDEKVTRRPTWQWRDRTVLGEDRLGALYLVSESGVEVLLAPAALRPRTAAMRVVRELAVAPALVDARRVLLHAAAVVHDGRGVLFAGPRTCGKTTMLAYVARAAGAAILGNDRTLLTADAAVWHARGVPTIVSLRRGTFDLVPDLGHRLPAVAVPVELTLAESAAAGGPCARPDGAARLKVSPRQLAHALETSLAPHAPLAAIVFPDPHGDADAVTITRLAPPAARERVQGARFGLHAEAEVPTVFARRGAAVRASGADATAFDRLAAEIPCFVVHVGAEAFHDADAAARMFDAVLR